MSNDSDDFLPVFSHNSVSYAVIKCAQGNSVEFKWMVNSRDKM